jgi:hypothetical protein
LRIGFSTAALARTFSEFDRLRRAFGDEMAYKLANRMAVLDAADTLALVPSLPPIGCRQLDGDARFGVMVAKTHRLVFCAIGANARKRTIDLARVTEIEIEGVR